MKRQIPITVAAWAAAMLLAGQVLANESQKCPPTSSQTGQVMLEETVQPLNRSQVQEMQRILTQKGFDAGAPTGYIGDDTRQAISDFQQSEGLAVTGNPNEETLRALAPLEDYEFFGLAPLYGEDKGEKAIEKTPHEEGGSMGY